MAILRYAGQAAIVVGAFWATLSVDPAQAQKFLVDAAQSAAAPEDLFLWMLGALVLITSASMTRLGVSGFASQLGAWWESHRQWLFAGVLGGVVLGTYCLM
jgi:hypothetical protein